MLFALLNMLKGRFSKEAISEAKSSQERMSRQEALQKMRNLASKRSGKKD
jgi:type II secretory pathway component PulJ